MEKPVVFVVDDDESMRTALIWLMGTVGQPVKGYTTAQAFREAYEPGTPGCLLLDLRMPEMGGLELQSELAAAGIDLPIIFITGHGDVQAAVHAMKAGAFDFIEKPFSNQVLLERVQKALATSAPAPASRANGHGRLGRLTVRERQVLKLVVTGKTNREIAAELGVSIKTIEFHRANVMAKMDAKSLAELIEKTAMVTLVPR